MIDGVERISAKHASLTKRSSNMSHMVGIKQISVRIRSVYGHARTLAPMAPNLSLRYPTHGTNNTAQAAALRAETPRSSPERTQHPKLHAVVR